MQELPGLQVYATESAICLSGALDEQSHQQVVRPPKMSYYRLWQPRQHREEAGVVDCCWIWRVRQRYRHGFEINFEGWSLALHHCLACALQHCPMSYRDSADSSPARCAARRCCSVLVATIVPALGPCQTTEGQTAAGWLGARDSAYAIPGSRVQEE